MAPTRAVVVAILAAASLGGWWLGRNGPGTASEEAVVVAVDDGDTIEVRIGARTDTVRLLGIDTPERLEDHLAVHGWQRRSLLAFRVATVSVTDPAFGAASRCLRRVRWACRRVGAFPGTLVVEVVTGVARWS